MFLDVDKKAYEIGVGKRLVAVINGRPITDAVLGTVKITMDKVSYMKFVILNNEVKSDAPITLDEALTSFGYSYYYFVDNTVSLLFAPKSDMHRLKVGDVVRHSGHTDENFKIIAAFFQSENPLYCLEEIEQDGSPKKDNDEDDHEHGLMFIFPADKLLEEGFVKITSTIMSPENKTLLDDLVSSVESQKIVEKKTPSLFIKRLEDGVVSLNEDGSIRVVGRECVFPTESEIKNIKNDLNLKD